MSDDWLEHGHEVDGSNLTPVFSSSTLLADGAGAPPPRARTAGWRAVLVGGSLALLATLGVVGVANAISDNLFPSMGASRPDSVWQNPVPPAAPAPTTLVVPTTDTTAPPTTAPTSTSTTTPVPPEAVPPTARSTSPSTSTATSSGRPATTALSPTTSMLDHDSRDDSLDDTPVDDDLLDDQSGSSSESDSSGSGSSGSDSSGSDSSGSGSSGSGSSGSGSSDDD